MYRVESSKSFEPSRSIEPCETFATFKGVPPCSFVRRGARMGDALPSERFEWFDCFAWFEWLLQHLATIYRDIYV